MIVAFVFFEKDNVSEVKYVKAERRYFEVSVEGKGEIVAAKCINIYPPELFFDRSLRIHEMKIDNLVKEGTTVKKGDFIAELDHSQLENRIKELEEEILQYEERLDIALLDSSVDLSGVRVNIQQVEDRLEDAVIRVEQSTYESPAIQRQVKIARDRIIRQLENAERNYERRKIYEKNAIKSLQSRLDRHKKELDKNQQLNSELKIYAPEDGIVIYARGRRGKVKTGDRISPYWGSVVATLPDLNNLDSEVYINEIEITKLAVGKEVRVEVDAIKEKQFVGVVKEISNIGTKSNEDDFKVYRVLVSLKDARDLKPSMSTLNSFVLDSVPEALIIPLNAVFGEENHNFVYLKKGMNVVKYEIELGMQNKLDVVVSKGLTDGDRILLREPDNAEDIRTIYLETKDSETALN